MLLRSLKLREWLRQAPRPQRPFLLLFCVLLLGLFLLAPRLVSLSYGNIDPSFNYAVNNAAASKKSFGTEFISTYGPLGYLVTNLLPQNVLKVTLWLGFYVAALAVGVYLFTLYYVKSVKMQWLAATLLVYIMAAASQGASVEWGYLVTFLIYCFIYLKLPKRAQWLAIVGLGSTAAIFSLTKFTLGFSALASLMAVCIFSGDRKLRLKVEQVCAAALVYLAVFVGLGRYLGIVSFPDYVRTALIESKNFGTAMATYDRTTAFATLFVAIALAALLFWPLLHGKKTFIKYLFIAPALVIMWKYAVVRQDAHLLRLIQLSIPLAYIIYVTLPRRTLKDRRMLFLIVLCSVLAVWANKLPFSQGESLVYVATTPIMNVQTHNYIEYFRLGDQKKHWESNSAAGLGGAVLPDSMKQKIGRAGVDVFPWETSIVAANDLTWNNRPSPFSFETYDPELDNANADFYQSKDSPRYVIWHNTGVASVDGRHILWDEPKTMKSLLYYYDMTESNDNFMLFEKRKNVDKELTTKDVYLGDIGTSHDWINLGRGSISFAHFNIHERKTQKLQAALIRGKAYYLLVKQSDGAVMKFRVVPENTGQGLMVNALPQDWQQLVDLFRNKSVNAQSDTQFRITSQQ